MSPSQIRGSRAPTSERLTREGPHAGADPQGEAGPERCREGGDPRAAGPEPWRAGVGGQSGPRQPRGKVTGTGRLAGPGQEERAHQAHSEHSRPLSRARAQTQVHKHQEATPPENLEGPRQEDGAQGLKGDPLGPALFFQSRKSRGAVCASSKYEWRPGGSGRREQMKSGGSRAGDQAERVGVWFAIKFMELFTTFKTEFYVKKKQSICTI